MRVVLILRETGSDSPCRWFSPVGKYSDKTSKQIVISQKSESCDLDDFEVHRKKVMRHEIIHAFLFESGLQENFKHDEYGHDETFIDWIAVQFPKMAQAFREANCL